MPGILKWISKLYFRSFTFITNAVIFTERAREAKKNRRNYFAHVSGMEMILERKTSVERESGYWSFGTNTVTFCLKKKYPNSKIWKGHRGRWACRPLQSSITGDWMPWVIMVFCGLKGKQKVVDARLLLAVPWAGDAAALGAFCCSLGLGNCKSGKQ